MTDIRIVRLRLENFKCHPSLDLDFRGRNASIFGDNAVGKTSIYDGMSWLLFGKDSAGNGEKNIEIKPLGPDGEVADRKAITSVEAVLEADGEEVALKRTYREIWTTRRGSSQEVYDGNTSEYFVDGVPHKKNAFDVRIRELVPEELFRMLTSVSHFARDLKWQERREILFQMARIGSDREIMARDEQFAPLLESLGKLSLDDYRKKLMSEKKGLTGIRNETPARLNELQKTVADLQGLDFEAARRALEDLERQKMELNSQLVALDNDQLAARKRLEIREAELDRKRLEEQNRAHRESQKADGPGIDMLQEELNNALKKASQAQEAVEREGSEVKRLEEQIAASRRRWINVKEEVFSGGKCPTCGQELPFEQLKAATSRFEKQQASRLQEIEENARTLIETQNAKKQRIAELEETVNEYRARAKVILSRMDEASSRTAEIRDMDGYADTMEAMNAGIWALQEELEQMLGSRRKVREGLLLELSETEHKARQCQDTAARESVLTYTRSRMDQLREEAQKAAATLEGIEKMLWLMEEYSRFKAKFVEDSINGLFRIATFRLHREQANGGLEDRCDVVCGGVPYMGLNNGMKINAGIDIINALSRFYGVTVPLFVDNAESVTRLEHCEAQVIRLVVSNEDKELRVAYEN